jgi:hypothetical protein
MHTLDEAPLADVSRPWTAYRQWIITTATSRNLQRVTRGNPSLFVVRLDILEKDVQRMMMHPCVMQPIPTPPPPEHAMTQSPRTFYRDSSFLCPKDDVSLKYVS